jgi:murein L,D-transpeptidase YcbB/YkuD
MCGGLLVEAVKHFQARHGLEPDGRIGKATLKQMNTPLHYPGASRTVMFHERARLAAA